MRELLDALGVKHDVDPRLVRGLDYYTGTIFEIKTSAGDLGAQNTIVRRRPLRPAGRVAGRPEVTPAIGFALGIERTLLAMPEAAESFEPALDVFFAPMDAAAVAFALPIAHAPARRQSGSRSNTARRASARC